jgi:hypothetical protein
MTSLSSGSTSKAELSEALELLFTARWNIPRAARHSGLTDDEMKSIFAEHCKHNPPRYNQNAKHV